MSELTCEVVQINKIDKHPNADSLSIVRIYDYPVIIRSEEWEVGDLGVYFPVGSILPLESWAKFLWQDRENPTEKQRMVKAIKLRGVFSMGLLIPIDKLGLQLNYKIGDNVADVLGVYEYEPPEPFSMGGKNERRPSWFQKYGSIENIRKYGGVLKRGEEIVLTEKIHGCCASFCWYEDRLWVSSRNLTKKLGGGDVWNNIAEKYKLAELLPNFSGLIFYGEIYGPIQKGFHYGSPKETSLILFDIFNINTAKYMDYDDFKNTAKMAAIPVVPEIFRGQWSSLEDLEGFAEGLTKMCDDKHIREGFVLRPTRERFNDEIGRVVLKIHGQTYLTRNK